MHKIPTKWLTSFGSFLVIVVAVVAGTVVVADAAAACFRLHVACVTTQQKAAKIFALCRIARAQLKMVGKGENATLTMEMHFPQIPFTYVFAEQPKEKPGSAPTTTTITVTTTTVTTMLAINNTKRLRKLGKTLLGLRKSFSSWIIKTTAL